MRMIRIYGALVIEGFTVMSLELLGFRLLAPFFGYSIYVFGSLIGLIMLALSTGYFLGGYFGDRGMSENKFFLIILAGALYLMATVISYQFMLVALAKSGVIVGSLIATFILFFIPMALLASISPYSIKVLTTQQQKVGFSAGSVYGVSTLGSIAGTFATAFYLVPELGVRTTLFINVGLMVIIPLLWLRQKRAMYLLALALIPLGAITAPAPNGKEILFARDSVYSRLEVVDFGNFIGLRTDKRSKSAHTYITKEGSDFTSMLYNLFGVAPLINGAKSALLLGVSGGVIPWTHEQFNQPMEMRGVEIDPAVIELGKQFFHRETLNNMDIAISDARPYLRKEKEARDLIEIDLFGGSANIPFYLATEEFFALVHDHLRENGIMAMNVYDPSDDRRIITPLANTIAKTFENVYVTTTLTRSHFILARDESIAIDEITVPSDAHVNLVRTINFFKKNAKKIEYAPDEITFTDDRAPLDRLSYQAILKPETSR